MTVSDRFDEMGLEIARTSAEHGFPMPRALASWVSALVRAEVARRESELLAVVTSRLNRIQDDIAYYGPRARDEMDARGVDEWRVQQRALSGVLGALESAIRAHGAKEGGAS